MRGWWLIAGLVAIGLAACATDPRRNPWSPANTPLAVSEYNEVSAAELFEAAEAGLSGEAQYAYGAYLYLAAAKRAYEGGDAAAAMRWLEAAATTPVSWRECVAAVSPSGDVSCRSSGQRISGLPEARTLLACLRENQRGHSAGARSSPADISCDWP